MFKTIVENEAAWHILCLHRRLEAALRIHSRRGESGFAQRLHQTWRLVLYCKIFEDV